MTKILSCAAVLGLLVASSSGVLAKGPGGAPSGGASSFTPRQQFIDAGGPVAGTHGASGYAPGQQMLNATTPNSSPGASGYTPGAKVRH
jgi:hypothetical protein